MISSSATCSCSWPTWPGRGSSISRPAGSTTGLKEIYVGNFRDTYERPGNPWDLKNCRQKLGETLREYIRRFSRECNALPAVADTDVIEALFSGTTCESLVHKLGRKSPRTTKELLDIATSHASSEEAVGAIFDHAKGKVKRDEDAGEGASNRQKKKKNKRNNGGSLVAAADRKGGKRPSEKPPAISKRCLRSRARTTPSPSSTSTSTSTGLCPHEQVSSQELQNKGAREEARSGGGRRQGEGRRLPGH
jgi:hypothetical protein